MTADRLTIRILIVSLAVSTTIVAASIKTAAQSDTTKTFYKDSTGKLFLASGTKSNLYIGLSSDGKNSVKVKGDNGNETIQWNGHGIKRLTRYNTILGRWVNLNIFADAMPPKTKLGYDSKKGVLNDNTIYLSGQGIVDLTAIDPDAGLKGIYYSLNEGAIINYVEPIRLKSEGEYKLSVFSIDNVGNKEEPIVKTIIVDNTPPLSHLDLTGETQENIVSGRSSLTITAIDALGVKQTYYSIDSGKVELYTNPIKTSAIAEGEHTIKWYSVDEVDNIEATKFFIFYVDKTPPMVFEEIVGNTYIVAGKEFSSGRSQLRIASVDNKSGVKEIKYSLNNSPFKVYDRPVYLSDIIGTASVKSFAIDNVGNQSTSDTRTESFTMPVVDITGPQISNNFIGPKVILRDTLWIGPKTKISISTNDIGSGVNRINFRIKGGEEKLYTEPFTLDTQGKQEIIYTAYDNVDNVNLLSFNLSVDNQSPSIFHHFSLEPIGWMDDSGEKIPVFLKGLKLYLASTDNISGVDRLGYSLNGSSEVPYNAPIEWFKPNTTYTLLIKSADILGNSVEKTIKFRVE